MAVVTALVLIELALSTLVALGVARTVTGYAIAGLFAGFGGYRLLVAARTRSMMCACAGPATYGPASPQAIAAAIVTAVLQVAMGCAWAIGGNYSEPHWVNVICAFCWTVPFIVMISGMGIRWRAGNGWFRHAPTSSPTLAAQADREPAAL